MSARFLEHSEIYKPAEKNISKLVTYKTDVDEGMHIKLHCQRNVQLPRIFKKSDIQFMWRRKGI